MCETVEHFYRHDFFLEYSRNPLVLACRESLRSDKGKLICWRGIIIREICAMGIMAVLEAML